MNALRTILEATPLAFCIWALCHWPADAATRLPDMASTDAMTLALGMMIITLAGVAIIAKHFSRRPM